jgi:hypothetical protein
VRGEVGRLVEPALAKAGAMERNRDDCVGAREDVAGAFPDEPGERARQRAMSAVLERVHDLAQRAVVQPHRANARDDRGTTAAARAAARVDCVASPRGERQTAAIAEGIGEWRDAGPAGPAHRPGSGRIERVSARGARGFDEDGEHRVGQTPRNLHHRP